MPDRIDYDIVIAGAGPAGSKAAYELSQSGCRVLVLEKKSFPRPKPCGGCLSKRAERFLPQPLLDEVIENRISRAVFLFNHRKQAEVWEYAAGMPGAYIINRERFDLLLAREAEQAGATVVFNQPVLSYQTFSDHVRVRTTEQEFFSRFLILANGAYPTIQPGWKGPRNPMAYHALEGRLPSSLWASPWDAQTVAIHLGAVSFGYGWIFPCADALSIGISCLPGRERSLSRSVQRFFNSLNGTSRFPRLKGHPIPCYNGAKRPYSRERVLWAGDAAHLVEPFLGEGIYYALWSGHLAAKHLRQALEKGEADLSSYDREISETILPEFAYALRLARWVYASPRLFWWLLKAYPGIMDIYFDILRGQERYERFFWELRKRFRRYTGLEWILGEPSRNSASST